MSMCGFECIVIEPIKVEHKGTKCDAEFTIYDTLLQMHVASSVLLELCNMLHVL